MLNQKIKNIYNNFFEKGNNIFNEEIFLNLDKNNQINILLRNIDIFSQELLNYKNNYFKNKNNIQNNYISNNEIDPQFYFKFIDLMNNFLNNLPNNNLNNIPIYSIKDKSDKKYNDILITIRILIDYIISNQNNNNNFASYNSSNDKINGELNKRLNEMSNLLVKSNEYLNKSRQENNELKKKYLDLEKKYNLSCRDNLDREKNNTIKEKNNELLINELADKNKQIKSLEHMITRLTQKSNNNNYNMNNKSSLTDTSYCGKIINKKIYNEIKNQSKNSFYLTNNNFIRDEKSELNLKNFLDKYTNGEYGNSSNYNENSNNNKVIINLKDEIENLNRGISNELSSYDEIDNEHNYNEEEEERKYQMEGKVNN